MRRLISALLFAAVLGTPTLASARDRDGWSDRDRYERRYDRYERRHDRDWRRDRWDDRRDWRDRRHHRGSKRYWRDHRRYADGYRYRYRGDNIVCRTYWHYDYPERVCYRRW